MKFNFLYNRKYYKYIIIGLILVVLIFLLLGNYNLRFKEGLNVEEQIEKLNQANNDASNGLKKSKEEENSFANKHATKAHIEGFLENSENMCDVEGSELIQGSNTIKQGVCDQINSIKTKN
jgi:hypothetical protein